MGRFGQMKLVYHRHFFFIEVLVPSQESERSCNWMLRGVDFSVGFWKCSDGVVFLEMFRRCGIFGFSFYYVDTTGTNI
jgi:hypothetical protein